MSVVALVVQKLVIVRSANNLDFAFNSSGRLGDGASATQAVAAGGGLVKSPQMAPWGGHHGYIKDPNGYLWEVAHYPVACIGTTDWRETRLTSASIHY